MSRSVLIAAVAVSVAVIGVAAWFFIQSGPTAEAPDLATSGSSTTPASAGSTPGTPQTTAPGPGGASAPGAARNVTTRTAAEPGGTPANVLDGGTQPAPELRGRIERLLGEVDEANRPTNLGWTCNPDGQTCIVTAQIPADGAQWPYLQKLQRDPVGPGEVQTIFNFLGSEQRPNGSYYFTVEVKTPTAAPPPAE